MTDKAVNIEVLPGKNVLLSDGLGDARYELWSYFNEEHGLVLLESQVDEIINLANKCLMPT